MKRKLILPVLAILLAAVASFATLPVQSAWYKPAVGAVTTGNITTPAPSSGITCVLAGQNLCKISGFQAYDTEAHAQAQGEDGRLRYDSME